MQKKLLWCVALMGAVLAACTPNNDERPPGSASGPDGANGLNGTDGLTGDLNGVELASGIDLEHMDRSVRPQDDFFRYVNGGWLASTDIPADRSRWGVFDQLRDQAEQHVLAIVREAAANPAESGSEAQKIGDLYRAFMDTESIEALGLQPLQPWLDEVQTLQSHEQLPAYWASSQARRSPAPLSFGIGQDPQRSDRYITSFGQSGLGLPDRDYYLNDEAHFRDLRAYYLQHVANMMELAGYPSPRDAARHVLDVETRLAEAQWARTRNRDRTATYNLMTPATLEQQAPGIDWSDYLAASGLPPLDELVVRQPDYLQALAGFYREFSMEAWRAYHSYHLLRQNAQWLPAAFVEEHFDFFGRQLSGQPEMRPREQRAVAAAESLLGFAVGRLYVERHFQPEASQRMSALVDNLLVAFEQAIDALEWMSAATKLEAKDKLAKLNTKIGHPEVWEDYSCLTISADQLLANVQRSRQCDFEERVARLGEPVDRDEWFMTPQTVNAYYSPGMNEIVFPAAILRPPFFNVDADDAVNYGAIGAVIGHEITHAFDDQGRRSDGDGNLRDWWAPSDEDQFRERAELMVRQFDAYEPLPGHSIQGALSLGENIADLGGLTISYQAWQHSLGDRPAPVIDGFTGAQRFFLGWGQVWRIQFREEALRRQLMTGPHAPGEYRVLGAVSNMPAFYEAFELNPGDELYREPDDRVKIW